MGFERKHVGVSVGPAEMEVQIAPGVFVDALHCKALATGIQTAYDKYAMATVTMLVGENSDVAVYSSFDKALLDQHIERLQELRLQLNKYEDIPVEGFDEEGEETIGQ